MAHLCFVCGHNPRLEGTVVCESCCKDYRFCFECGEKERTFPFKLCSSCYESSHLRRRPKLSASRPKKSTINIFHKLQEGQSTYKGIVKHFKRQWAKEKLTDECPRPPTPLAIYAIKNPPLVERFHTYGEQIRREQLPSNADHFFHGTKLTCDILSAGSPCDDPDCGVCGISRSGFDRDRIGTNIPRFKRFGHGIYLAPNSSKCHDYTQGVPEYNVRAQLLCLVACGAKYELMQDNTALTRPPDSFHSVYGKAGIDLNYDEIVVYDPDAVLPQYVVVYEHQGVEKIAK